MIDAASSSFWSKFWPAVVATFVGVAVGVPGALRIQRVLTGQADRTAKQEDDNLRRNVMATLARSVRSNSVALSALHDRLANEHSGAALVTRIDLGTWEATRDEAVRLITDQPLRVALVRYVSRLAGCDRAAVVLSEALMRQWVTTGGGTNPFILPLRREVLAEISELAAISSSLEAALTDAAGLNTPEPPAANAS